MQPQKVKFKSVQKNLKQVSYVYLLPRWHLLTKKIYSTISVLFLIAPTIAFSDKNKYIDSELLIDLPPLMGNFVHYHFLKLYYIWSKMTHVSPLSVGALLCYSLITTLPYNSFQTSCANTNLYLNLTYQHDGLKATKLNTANHWYAQIQLKSIILQLYTLLTFTCTTI